MMDFNAFYIEKKMMEKTTGCRVPCKYKVTLKHCTLTVKIFSLFSETNVLMVREAVKVKKKCDNSHDIKIFLCIYGRIRPF